jgi:hypothetical protein
VPRLLPWAPGVIPAPCCRATVRFTFFGQILRCLRLFVKKEYPFSLSAQPHRGMTLEVLFLSRCVRVLSVDCSGGLCACPELFFLILGDEFGIPGSKIPVSLGVKRSKLKQRA